MRGWTAMPTKPAYASATRRRDAGHARARWRIATRRHASGSGTRSDVSSATKACASTASRADATPRSAARRAGQRGRAPAGDRRAPRAGARQHLVVLKVNARAYIRHKTPSSDARSRSRPTTAGNRRSKRAAELAAQQAAAASRHTSRNKRSSRSKRSKPRPRARRRWRSKRRSRSKRRWHSSSRCAQQPPPPAQFGQAPAYPQPSPQWQRPAQSPFGSAQPAHGAQPAYGAQPSYAPPQPAYAPPQPSGRFSGAGTASAYQTPAPPPAAPAAGEVDGISPETRKWLQERRARAQAAGY